MNDTDLLQRAKVERDEIFERYDKGRNNVIHSWEDNTFEVYHRTDRYALQFLRYVHMIGRSSNIGRFLADNVY